MAHLHPFVLECCLSGLLPGNAPCSFLSKSNAACSEAQSDISLTDNEDAGSEEVCCAGRAVSAVPCCIQCRVASSVAHMSSRAAVLCHAWGLPDTLGDCLTGRRQLALPFPPPVPGDLLSIQAQGVPAHSAASCSGG